MSIHAKPGIIGMRVACTAAAVGGLVLLAGTGAALGGTVFEDQFDTYSAGSLLSAASPSWVISDGCNDGKVNTDNPFTAPNTVTDYKDGSTNLRLGYRNRHDLTAAEMLNAGLVHDPNPNCIDGTDAHPLVFWFKMYLGPRTSNVYYHLLNVYAELSCGDDRAPTPMIMADCDGKARPHLNLDGDGQFHKSIAVGQIAWADTDPCNVVTSQVAQNFRLTLYDGRQWRILQTPVELHTCGAYNYVTLTVKTSTIDVELSTVYNGTDCTGPRQTLTTTVSRQYAGPFTAIKIGGIPNETTGTGGCWGEDTGSYGYPSQQTVVDDILLTDGEAFNNPEVCPVTGACCLPGPTLGCAEQTTESGCTGLGGNWKGANSTCSDPTINNCCPTPFADIDDDDDVDQADFSYFQACITGPGVFALEGVCKCFDVTDSLGGGPDDAVDDNDLGKFEVCVSGPGIPLDPACF